jgi:hypothetical protein
MLPARSLLLAAQRPDFSVTICRQTLEAMEKLAFPKNNSESVTILQWFKRF